MGIDYLVKRWSWFKAVVTATNEAGFTVKITDEGACHVLMRLCIVMT